MDIKDRLKVKAPVAHPGFKPELLALLVSAGALYHCTGYSPSDHDTLMIITCYLQFLIPTFTLFLSLTLLHLRLLTHPSPSPAYQRLIHRLSMATLATTFTTLIITLATTNSWAELTLIVLAITIGFKLINASTRVSCFQQYIKVSIFCLSVAITGVYNEPLDLSSVIYRTYQIHRFGLIPCTFLLGVLLMVIGVTVPGDSVNIRFLPVGFKEVFAKLTLSVGCVTLVIGNFLMVCTASVLSSAMPL